VGELLARELKDEILGKTFPVASHLLIEPTRVHAVQRGQIVVEQNLLITQHEDVMRDRLQRERWCWRAHEANCGAFTASMDARWFRRS